MLHNQCRLLDIRILVLCGAPRRYKVSKSKKINKKPDDDVRKFLHENTIYSPATRRRVRFPA